MFTPFTTFFVNQNHWSDWFMREFPAFVVEHQVEVVEILRAFITPKMLSTRLGTTKDSIGLVGYQPNHVARQFGFS